MKKNIIYQKLQKIKKAGLKVIAVDFDGTIYDRYDKKYNKYSKVVELAHKVTNKGIDFAFVSGRNTTLELPLRKEFLKYCKKNKCSISIWRSGGNGMNLYKITYLHFQKKPKVKKIYSNSISYKDISVAINMYKTFNINPDKKSQNFFLSFVNKDIPKDLVPNRFMKINQQFKGSLFAESVKITFVLPKDIEEQEKYINLFRKKLLKSGLNVGWGQIPFVDISKKLRYHNKIIDGKLLMVKELIKALKIKKTQIVTFGDAPNNNNKGLLSLPYSFTNEVIDKRKQKNSPPYILKVKNNSVEAVYDAIEYLVS